MYSVYPAWQTLRQLLLFAALMASTVGTLLVLLFLEHRAPNSSHNASGCLLLPAIIFSLVLFVLLGKKVGVSKVFDKHSLAIAAYGKNSRTGNVAAREFDGRVLTLTGSATRHELLVAEGETLVEMRWNRNAHKHYGFLRVATCEIVVRPFVVRLENGTLLVFDHADVVIVEPVDDWKGYKLTPYCSREITSSEEVRIIGCPVVGELKGKAAQGLPAEILSRSVGGVSGYRANKAQTPILFIRRPPEHPVLLVSRKH